MSNKLSGLGGRLRQSWWRDPLCDSDGGIAVEPAIDACRSTSRSRTDRRSNVRSRTTTAARSGLRVALGIVLLLLVAATLGPVRVSATPCPVASGSIGAGVTTYTNCAGGYVITMTANAATLIIDGSSVFNSISIPNARSGITITIANTARLSSVGAVITVGSSLSNSLITTTTSSTITSSGASCITFLGAVTTFSMGSAGTTFTCANHDIMFASTSSANAVTFTGTTVTFFSGVGFANFNFVGTTAVSLTVSYASASSFTNTGAGPSNNVNIAPTGTTGSSIVSVSLIGSTGIAQQSNIYMQYVDRFTVVGVDATLRSQVANAYIYSSFGISAVGPVITYGMVSFTSLTATSQLTVTASSTSNFYANVKLEYVNVATVTMGGTALASSTSGHTGGIGHFVVGASSSLVGITIADFNGRVVASSANINGRSLSIGYLNAVADIAQDISLVSTGSTFAGDYTRCILCMEDTIKGLTLSMDAATFDKNVVTNALTSYIYGETTISITSASMTFTAATWQGDATNAINIQNTFSIPVGASPPIYMLDGLAITFTGATNLRFQQSFLIVAAPLRKLEITAIGANFYSSSSTSAASYIFAQVNTARTLYDSLNASLILTASGFNLIRIFTSFFYVDGGILLFHTNNAISLVGSGNVPSPATPAVKGLFNHYRTKSNLKTTISFVSGITFTATSLLHFEYTAGSQVTYVGGPIEMSAAPMVTFSSVYFPTVLGGSGTLYPTENLLLYFSPTSITIATSGALFNVAANAVISSSGAGSFLITMTSAASVVVTGERMFDVSGTCGGVNVFITNFIFTLSSHAVSLIAGTHSMLISMISSPLTVGSTAITMGTGTNVINFITTNGAIRVASSAGSLAVLGSPSGSTLSGALKISLASVTFDGGLNNDLLRVAGPLQSFTYHLFQCGTISLSGTMLTTGSSVSALSSEFNEVTFIGGSGKTPFSLAGASLVTVSSFYFDRSPITSQGPNCFSMYGGTTVTIRFEGTSPQVLTMAALTTAVRISNPSTDITMTMFYVEVTAADYNIHYVSQCLGTCTISMEGRNYLTASRNVFTNTFVGILGLNGETTLSATGSTQPGGNVVVTALNTNLFQFALGSGVVTADTSDVGNVQIDGNVNHASASVNFVGTTMTGQRDNVKINGYQFDFLMMSATLSITTTTAGVNFRNVYIYSSFLPATSAYLAGIITISSTSFVRPYTGAGAASASSNFHVANGIYTLAVADQMIVKDSTFLGGNFGIHIATMAYIPLSITGATVDSLVSATSTGFAFTRMGFLFIENCGLAATLAQGDFTMIGVSAIGRIINTVGFATASYPTLIHSFAHFQSSFVQHSIVIDTATYDRFDASYNTLRFNFLDLYNTRTQAAAFGSSVVTVRNVNANFNTYVQASALVSLLISNQPNLYLYRVTIECMTIRTLDYIVSMTPSGANSILDGTSITMAGVYAVIAQTAIFVNGRVSTVSGNVPTIRLDNDVFQVNRIVSYTGVSGTLSVIAGCGTFNHGQYIAAGFLATVPALMPITYTPTYCTPNAYASCFDTKSHSRSTTETMSFSDSAIGSVSASQSNARSDSFSLSNSDSPTSEPSRSYSLSASVSLSPSPTTSLTNEVSLSSSLTTTGTVSMSNSNELTASRSLTLTKSISQSTSTSPTDEVTASDSPSVSPSETTSLSPSGSGSSTTSISQSYTMTMSLTLTLTNERSQTTSVTASNEKSLTLTLMPTVTPSQSQSQARTDSASQSSSESQSPSVSPSLTAEPTMSVSTSNSFSMTPSATSELSASRSLTLSGSQSSEVSASRSVSLTISATITMTLTEEHSKTPTQSPTESRTDELSASTTSTGSTSASPTLTVSVTNEDTKSKSVSDSMTRGSHTITRTVTTSDSPTFTMTMTVSLSCTNEASSTRSNSASASDSASVTRDASPTGTASRTDSFSTSASETPARSATRTTSVDASPSRTTSDSVWLTTSDSYSTSLTNSTSETSSGTTSTTKTPSTTDERPSRSDTSTDSHSYSPTLTFTETLTLSSSVSQMRSNSRTADSPSLSGTNEASRTTTYTYSFTLSHTRQRSFTRRITSSATTTVDLTGTPITGTMSQSTSYTAERTVTRSKTLSNSGQPSNTKSGSFSEGDSVSWSGSGSQSQSTTSTVSASNDGPSRSFSSSGTVTQSQSPTSSGSPSPSTSSSDTQTPERSSSRSNSPSTSATPSASPSVSPASPTLDATASPTESATPSPSSTDVLSGSRSLSTSFTSERTLSGSRTLSPQASKSQTSSLSQNVSESGTRSRSQHTQSKTLSWFQLPQGLTESKSTSVSLSQSGSGTVTELDSFTTTASLTTTLSASQSKSPTHTADSVSLEATSTMTITTSVSLTRPSPSNTKSHSPTQPSLTNAASLSSSVSAEGSKSRSMTRSSTSTKTPVATKTITIRETRSGSSDMTITSTVTVTPPPTPTHTDTKTIPAPMPGSLLGFFSGVLDVSRCDQSNTFFAINGPLLIVIVVLLTLKLIGVHLPWVSVDTYLHVPQWRSLLLQHSYACLVLPCHMHCYYAHFLLFFLHANLLLVLVATFAILFPASTDAQAAYSCIFATIVAQCVRPLFNRLYFWTSIRRLRLQKRIRNPDDAFVSMNDDNDDGRASAKASSVGADSDWATIEEEDNLSSQYNETEDTEPATPPAPTPEPTEEPALPDAPEREPTDELLNASFSFDEDDYHFTKGKSFRLIMGNNNNNNGGASPLPADPKRAGGGGGRKKGGGSDNAPRSAGGSEIVIDMDSDFMGAFELDDVGSFPAAAMSVGGDPSRKPIATEFNAASGFGDTMTSVSVGSFDEFLEEGSTQHQNNNASSSGNPPGTISEGGVEVKSLWSLDMGGSKGAAPLPPPPRELFWDPRRAASEKSYGEDYLGAFNDDVRRMSPSSMSPELASGGLGIRRGTWTGQPLDGDDVPDDAMVNLSLSSMSIGSALSDLSSSYESEADEFERTLRIKFSVRTHYLLASLLTIAVSAGALIGAYYLRLRVDDVPTCGRYATAVPMVFVIDCLFGQTVFVAMVYLHRYLQHDDGVRHCKFYSELHPINDEVRVMSVERGTLYVRRLKASHRYKKELDRMRREGVPDRVERILEEKRQLRPVPAHATAFMDDDDDDDQKGPAKGGKGSREDGSLSSSDGFDEDAANATRWDADDGDFDFLANTQRFASAMER